MAPGNNVTTNVFGPFVLNLSQYTRAENDPHALSLSGFHDSVAPQARVIAISSRRNNIEALTSIELDSATGGADLLAGSFASLYFVPRRARLIERIVLDADAPSVTFAGIPADFDGDEIRALQLNVYTRDDRATDQDPIRVEFNGDIVNANYEHQDLEGNAGAVAASQAADPLVASVPGNAAAANVFAGGVLVFTAHQETDRHKSRLFLFGNAINRIRMGSGRWLNTVPVTNIRLSPEAGTVFRAGSVFELEAVVLPSADTTHLTFNASFINLTQNINYLGTWRTYPTITIRGPVQNPRIDNLTTGEKIELEHFVDAARTVTITLTPETKTIEDDLGTNLLGRVTSDSDLATFHIAPEPEAPNGVNQILFQGGSTSLATLFTLTYQTRYFGI